MIHRIGVICRRDGDSLKTFTNHWISVHGELARHLPGLRDYRQNHIRARLFEAAPWPMQPIDGLSQLQFDDLAAMEAAEVSPEYAETKLDIPKFQGAITVLVTSPLPILADEAPQEAPHKVLVLQKIAPHSAALQDPATWQARMARNLSAIPGLCRSTMNLVVDKDHPVAAGVVQGDPVVDGVLELWFRDQATLDSAMRAAPQDDWNLGNAEAQTIAVYQVDELYIVREATPGH